MDFDAITNLMKQMDQSGLSLLEVQSEGMHIKMQKNLVEPTVKLSQEAFMDMPMATEAEVKTEYKEIKNEVKSEIKAQSNNYKEITSPIVGTFYEAIGPNKPVLAKAGDIVKKGQTLCVIEAMKLMNEIESDYDGEIIEVLAKNDQLVEYGQPLFKIAPHN
jgi:acetyl-CoA carboxylase biotin carboxyl carrier protein